MCGVCHPGGDSLEYDRNGIRYDLFAKNPKNHIIPGETNSLDGDYYKSDWAKSGVLEADCLMCHLKDYNNEARKKQISALNFRWAATAGAGFGEINGSVAKKGTPTVKYDLTKFGPDGKVTLPVMKKPLNENCLFCHHESGWKKRGQSFSKRTDVHMRAGLLCVDCHVTGRSATDPRIYGREEHQIGKGDDPGDFVRDDLDNTMRTCEDCHEKGILNAPIPKHKGLPPSHFDHIACQTCHMPWHQVKAALIQDASVFNTSPRIWPPPKRIWSFYGPDMKPWNYYGFERGYPEGLQPFTQFRPVHAFYKGKIYPVNRVYTRWVGIKTNGKPGIGMPHMKDIFMMWKTHMNDPNKNYPLLSKIKDDNKDGYSEVNRPEEIRALLDSVISMLKNKGESLEGKTIVFVDGDRYTSDGKTWTNIPKKPYEYSPYGSVFKYSHDVCPAKNALGAKGCTDCHSSNSDFFYKEIMVRPFNEQGKPLKENNAVLLGYSSHALRFMAFQFQILKPLFIWLLLIVLFLMVLHYVIFGPKRVERFVDEDSVLRFGAWERVLHYCALVAFVVLAVTGTMTFLTLPFSSRTIGELNVIHRYFGYLFIVNVLLIFGTWLKDATFARYDWEWLKKLGGYFGYRGQLPAARFNAGQKIYLWLSLLFAIILGVTGLIMIHSHNSNLLFIMHCIHVLVAMIFIFIVLVHIYLGILANPGTLIGIFEGKVLRSWAKKHHPLWETRDVRDK